jgi:hypothetical protein
MVLFFCRHFTALLQPVLSYAGFITFAQVYGQYPHNIESGRSAGVFWPSCLNSCRRSMNIRLFPKIFR